MVLHTQNWNIYDVSTEVLIDLIVTIFFSPSFRLILECFATFSDRNGLTAFKNIVIGSKLIIQTTLSSFFISWKINNVVALLIVTFPSILHLENYF